MSKPCRSVPNRLGWSFVNKRWTPFLPILVVAAALPVAAFAQQVEPPPPAAGAVERNPSAPPAQVQPKAGTKAQPKATAESRRGKLKFAFNGTPWGDVIRWVAEQSGLALHVRDLPTGSFTYSDPEEYTTERAIDRVNLFLLSQGYSLVQSGKLLAVVNLGDPRSVQQLDALARLVKVEQLDSLSDHQVVKCVFPLGRLKAEEAVEELGALKLMTTPAVFTRTNRLMVTDTAKKLKSAKLILDAFRPDQLENGRVVKSFELQHVEAEDILVVARPHLGLATGEMIGIDVSVSADVTGKKLFVTGVEDKVKMIENLVSAIDQKKQGLTTAGGEAQLQAHPVDGGNVELVYNVLQTLLADKSVRLSMDEEAGTIVALAAADVQADIRATVAQLQASDAQFEVIPLKTIDPYFAISLLEQMLDLPDPLLDDPEDIDPHAPKIDADPGNKRLFVRAKKHDLEQIKNMVARLDGEDGAETDESIRRFALHGERAERTLVTAARFWRRENPIILYPSAGSHRRQRTERVLTEVSADAESEPTRGQGGSPRYLTDNLRSQASPIRCQITPRGLLIQCDDQQALDRFVKQLQAVAGPAEVDASPPVVFYLKYTRADDALRTLAELLDGGAAATAAAGGSLVNGQVSSGSFLGSLVTSRQGTTTMTSDTITVVADSRLNRLIAQGTAEDIELIERYLKIVDKDNSITAVEVYGTSHIIELKHTKAVDVAAAIREAYGERVSRTIGSPQSARPAAGGSRPAEAAAVAAAAKGAAVGDKGDSAKAGPDGEKKQVVRRPGGNQPTRNLEPKMTIAVHEPSNSLIVTAPDSLFREVEKLCQTIDARGEQIVEVVTPRDAGVVDVLLQAFPGAGRASGGRSRGATGSGPTTTPARGGGPARPTAPSVVPGKATGFIRPRGR